MTTVDYQGGRGVDEVKASVGVDSVIKLSSNENPVGMSPKVAALLADMVSGLNRYPPRKDDAFRQALADYHGCGLTADYFITGDSGSTALELFTRAFVNDGDEYIICPPTFGVYKRMGSLQRASAVEVPLDPDDFSMDVDAVLNAITERTRLIYLCNPNNPTGAMIPAATMDALVKQLPDHVYLISDEVYHHYVGRDDYPDSVQYVVDGKNVLIVHSFSKAFGLAGLRLGYGIARPDVAAQAEKFRRIFHINALGMAAGVAALSDLEHVERTVANNSEGKAYLYAELARLGVRYWPTEGNYVLVQPSVDAERIHARLERRGIMVRYMDGDGLSNCLRVSIGLMDENRAFIAALGEIVAEEQSNA
jgi:histidinol-phosphate aminotransferase